MREQISDDGRHLPAAETVAQRAAQIPTADLVPAERASTVTIPRAMSPRARRKRRLRAVAVVVALAALLVTGGWATWTYAIPHYTHVPNLAGATVKSATSRLQHVG